MKATTWFIQIFFLQFLRYTMIVIMTMMILTTVLQRCTCIISTVGKPAGPLMVECPNSTWMANSPFGLTMRPQNLYTRCFYVVAMLFTAATCGLFDPMEHYVFDVLVFIALFTVLALLKVIVWAEITSHRVSKATSTHLHHSPKMGLRVSIQWCSTALYPELLEENDSAFCV